MSLIGAVVLYVLAIGSVRGFALFLGISTILDLIVAYFFMHPVVSLMARRPRLVKMKGIGIEAGLDAPHRDRRDARRARRRGCGVTATAPAPPAEPKKQRHTWADLYHERTHFQFIKHSRRWAIISGTLILISVARVRGQGPQPRHRLRGRHAVAVHRERRRRARRRPATSATCSTRSASAMPRCSSSATTPCACSRRT